MRSSASLASSLRHNDVRSTHYRRSFVLSDELETDKTEASIKDGVLTMRIPKRAEMRPRRIELPEHEL
jgi:HSP20 family molecular chaperone IbpA